MGAHVEIRGIRSTSERIKVLGDRSKDLRPLWPKVEEYLRDQFVRQFETEGAALGEPWKPLSATRAAEKAAMGLRDILVETGGLRASYAGDGRWSVSKATEDSLVVGSRHPLAHIHQYGTAGKRVPARPVLKVTPAMRRHVRNMIRDYILA